MALAQILRQNGLSAIEVTEGEYHVKLECAAPNAPIVPVASVPVPHAVQPDPSSEHHIAVPAVVCRSNDGVVSLL